MIESEDELKFYFVYFPHSLTNSAIVHLLDVRVGLISTRTSFKTS